MVYATELYKYPHWQTTNRTFLWITYPNTYYKLLALKERQVLKTEPAAKGVAG